MEQPEDPGYNCFSVTHGLTREATYVIEWFDSLIRLIRDIESLNSCDVELWIVNSRLYRYLQNAVI